MTGKFIPFKGGRQLFSYDDRNLRIKLYMWLWKKLSRKIKYKTIYGETISGEKKVYYGCTFTRCKFQNCRLVFINNCMIEHETPRPELSNMMMCEVKSCVFKRIKPLKEKVK